MIGHESVICSTCGEKISIDEFYDMDDRVLCQECLDTETSICRHCDCRVWNSENAGTDYFVLCQDCYDRFYVRCENCDEIINYEEAFYEDGNEDSPYCIYCHNANNAKKAIHDYSYKPNPIFFGDEERYFGVELELDRGGRNYNYAQMLLDLANADDSHIYIKADSSLDNGLEIVTHPMTLNYHIQTMPWRLLIKQALDLGYYSHIPGTAGLHIHVNRDCFGKKYTEQEENIARVLYFVEMFWNEMLCFSRRTESQMKQWAARYGRKDSPKATMDHIKQGCASRYTCINLVNSQTIEFRMFRGTLRYNTLIATLQMVNEICNVAISMSDEAMDTLSWNSFVSGIDVENSPELIFYLKERQLYINEPVLCEEEI